MFTIKWFNDSKWREWRKIKRKSKKKEISTKDAVSLNYHRHRDFSRFFCQKNTKIVNMNN